MSAMVKPDSYCHFCGAAWPAAAAGWPRTCQACENVAYKNPLPVAVLLIPVDDGVLTVRRAFGRTKGQLALPGGFIELGESWQAAAAREALEEAGVPLDPEKVRDFQTRSAPDGTVLIFGLYGETLRSDALPPFEPNSEVSERLVTREAATLAFPLHTDALAAWFAAR